MTELKDRLKLARKRRKLSQPQLADAVGMSQSNLSDLETGKSKGSGLLPQIAKELKVNALWLATGEGPMESTSAPAPAIPQSKAAVILAYNPEGEPDPAGDMLIMLPWKLAELGNPDPAKLLIHYATDDSMATEFKQGSLTLINTALTSPAAGKVYLLNIGGKPYLRRMVDAYGRWKIRADAPGDPGEYLDELDAVIVGQVIW